MSIQIIHGMQKIYVSQGCVCMCVVCVFLFFDIVIVFFIARCVVIQGHFKVNALHQKNRTKRFSLILSLHVN